MIRAVLRQALNQALRWGLVARNAALADPPKSEQFAAIPLTLADAEKLLAAAQGKRLEALYCVALSLGLR